MLWDDLRLGCFGGVDVQLGCAVQSNRFFYLAQDGAEAAFHARGRGPVARVLVQHAADYGKHWLHSAEDRILPFPRVVFQ